MKLIGCRWQKFVGGLMVASAMSVPCLIAGEKVAGQADQQTNSAEEKDSSLKLKMFSLNHADPEEVRQIVNQVWGASATMPAPNPIRLASNAPVSRIPGTARTNAVASPAPARVAIDARTRTLFVRGTEKELERIKDLVTVLDGEAGKPTPEVKNLYVFHLQFAKVDDGLQVLNALDLGTQVIPLRRSNTLVIRASNPHSDEIREIIAKVDVEQKADGNKTANQIDRRTESKQRSPQTTVKPKRQPPPGEND